MTYAISDLHGRVDLYREILEKISFCAEDTLYILGDIGDRNEGGIQIFKQVMDRPNIHMLMGNHEQMMLDAILHPNGISLNGDETNEQLWFRNGGSITKKEYLAEPEGLQYKILQYIESLPLNIELNVNGTEYLLVHGMPTCMFEKYGREYENVAEFAVWERIEGWMKVEFPADVMICGHTPTWYYRDENPMRICSVRKNVYDIDCGCSTGEEFGGRLACLRLDDMKGFYTGEVLY